MIELFSRRQADHFKGLGIHSLPGHIRKMEKDLLRATAPAADGEEATEIEPGRGRRRALSATPSSARWSSSAAAPTSARASWHQGKTAAVFPTREDPKVADYSVKKTYGRLLDMVEQAFSKEKPLFSLAIYYPLAYYKGDRAQIGSSSSRAARSRSSA